MKFKWQLKDKQRSDLKVLRFSQGLNLRMAKHKRNILEIEKRYLRTILEKTRKVLFITKEV